MTNCQPTSLCVCEVCLLTSHMVHMDPAEVIIPGCWKRPCPIFGNTVVIRINCKSELVIAFRATPCVPRSAPSISQIPRACEH